MHLEVSYYYYYYLCEKTKMTSVVFCVYVVLCVKHTFWQALLSLTVISSAPFSITGEDSVIVSTMSLQ